MKFLSIPIGLILLCVLAPGNLRAQSGEVVIRGTIHNGTNDRGQRVEELRLMRLQGGMQVLQIISDAGPDFEFAPAPADAPLLLRASYGGTAYTKMIPPAPRFQNQEHKLEVFEPGASREDVTITPLLQLVNTRDGLRVQRVYAVENNSSPPRSFAGAPLIFVPDDAGQIRGQLRNPGSQMQVPISLQKEGEFRRPDRAFRPGRSLLTIDFLVKDRQFEDRMPETAGADAATNSEAKERFAIVLWRPSAARPKISGGQLEEINIPNEGPAYRVGYPTDGRLKISTDNRNFFFENPVAEHENAFLNHPARTAIALVVILTGFFFLISLLGSLLRNARKPA